mmetsp:Transcript_20191/g.34809  ORF Transcript_20191/g.34809 Transcript_20191/m.34809 type:complete len:317 (+) Transcript_20191:258-1208(+)
MEQHNSNTKVQEQQGQQSLNGTMGNRNAEGDITMAARSAYRDTVTTPSESSSYSSSSISTSSELAPSQNSVRNHPIYEQSQGQNQAQNLQNQSYGQQQQQQQRAIKMKTTIRKINHTQVKKQSENQQQKMAEVAKSLVSQFDQYIMKQSNNRDMTADRIRWIRMNLLPSVYSRVGADAIATLATQFYQLIYGDDELKQVFVSGTQEEATNNQIIFLTKLFGGPVDQKEIDKSRQCKSSNQNPNLMSAAHNNVNESVVQRYLEHMNAAMTSVPEFGSLLHQYPAIMDYFVYTTYWIVFRKMLAAGVTPNASGFSSSQ